MERENIDRILSFDSDFDKVEGIVGYMSNKGEPSHPVPSM
jgi:hypothetical protein